MNRTEMIKWLSENTTREQWEDSDTLFFIGDHVCDSIKNSWVTHRHNFNNGIYVRYIGGGQPQQNITIDDVFEPVNEQPVYIDGGIYEIGVMNGEPQQFVYNLKLNMFERGSNESIGASNVHDSKVVTHFKLVSGPCSERVTVAKEIINNIRCGANNEFMDSSAVTSELQGLLNHRRDEVPIGKVTSSEITEDGVNITMGLNPEHPLFKPEPSSAVKILNDAAECIGDRAAERDTDNERSMLSTVNAFNAMYGTELTETQGWMFMVFLKVSRAKQGDFREDDYTDGSSYFALAGECDGNVRR